MKSNFPKISLFVSMMFLLFSSSSFIFLYKETNNNEKNRKLAETEWSVEASKRYEMGFMTDSIKAIEKERLSLETHFARQSDVVPFLNTVEQLAREVGAKADITSVAVLANNLGLVAEVKSVGSFASVYKFLLLLENSPYEIEFSSVGIENTKQAQSEKSSEGREWRGDFKIKLLSFVP